MTTVEPELGTFMTLESLCLGVAGKASMWKALTELAEQLPSLASVNLEELIDRARTQHEALELERVAAARRALANHLPTSGRRGL